MERRTSPLQTSLALWVRRNLAAALPHIGRYREHQPTGDKIPSVTVGDVDGCHHIDDCSLGAAFIRVLLPFAQAWLVYMLTAAHTLQHAIFLLHRQLQSRLLFGEQPSGLVASTQKAILRPRSTF